MALALYMTTSCSLQKHNNILVIFFCSDLLQ